MCHTALPRPSQGGEGGPHMTPVADKPKQVGATRAGPGPRDRGLLFSLVLKLPCWFWVLWIWGSGLSPFSSWEVSNSGLSPKSHRKLPAFLCSLIPLPNLFPSSPLLVRFCLFLRGHFSMLQKSVTCHQHFLFGSLGLKMFKFSSYKKNGNSKISCVFVFILFFL